MKPDEDVGTNDKVPGAEATRTSRDGDTIKAAGISGAFVSALISAGCLFLCGRLVSGQWQSLWSFVSTVLLLMSFILPFMEWDSEEQSTKNATALGMLVGAALGGGYGLLTSAAIKGIFFSACLGTGVGWGLGRLGVVDMPDSFSRQGSLRTAVSVLCALIPLHWLGIISPTKTKPTVAYGKADPSNMSALANTPPALNAAGPETTADGRDTVVASPQAETRKPPPPHLSEDEPINDIPMGLTDPGGIRVGPYYNTDELRSVVGRFIQEEARPGWPLQQAVAVLGKPTKFTRFDALSGSSESHRQSILNDPLISPRDKRGLLKQHVICTWSHKENPGEYFFMLSFTDEKFVNDEGSIVIRLPKQ